MKKQMAFYLTDKSSEQLDKIQEMINDNEGKVTKAYILNQSIYKYYDFIEDFYEKEESIKKLDELLERAGASKKDLERTALFYIVAGNDDLYKKVDYIYNFKEGTIEPDCLESDEVDFCSSSKSLIRLAYSLFNGFPADVFETFYSLDHKNYKLVIEAINIRFNK